MFILSEEEFNKEYLTRRVKDITEEVNSMPMKERLNFVFEIKKNVLNSLIKEQALAKLKYKTIDDLINQYKNE